MSMSNRVTMTTVSIILFFSQTTLAAEPHHADGQKPRTGVHLSADLHNLLGQEMVAIENGMQDLIPAISAGEWERVAAIAQEISDSFIMKQQLTPAQKEELHRELPPLFVEMDQDFHKSAAMMAHAAGMKNADVVNFYFFKLNNACVTCHGKYAPDRFPGLQKGAETDSHQH